MNHTRAPFLTPSKVTPPPCLYPQRPSTRPVRRRCHRNRVLYLTVLVLVRTVQCPSAPTKPTKPSQLNAKQTRNSTVPALSPQQFQKPIPDAISSLSFLQCTVLYYNLSNKSPDLLPSWVRFDSGVGFRVWGFVGVGVWLVGVCRAELVQDRT